MINKFDEIKNHVNNNNCFFSIINSEKSVVYNNLNTIIIKTSNHYNKSCIANYFYKHLSIRFSSIRVMCYKSRRFLLRNKYSKISCYKKFLLKII